MKKLRILLVQPASNIMKNRKEGKPALMPLGLMYIAGTLQTNGFNKIKIMDVLSEGYYNETEFKKDYLRYGLSPEQIKAKIKRFKPDIVGVSIMASIRKYHGYEVCNLAKEVNKNIITVVGGNHVTCFPQEALDEKNVNFAVLGEGEKPFLELVQHLERAKNPKLNKIKLEKGKINGLAFIDNEGKRQIRPQIYWEKDIDHLPFPAHNLINFKLYHNIWKKEGYQVYEARRFTMSMMARGCCNSCKHCCHNVIFPGYRARSAENLFNEVKMCYELYGIREIQYHEYNGLVIWDIVKKFCELMIESGLNKKVRWGWPIGIWLKVVTREKLKLMREAGMDYLCLAIESYDQKKLDEVMPGKDVDLKHTLNVIKWGREFGYQLHAFFMLGIEGQSKKDIEKTIEFCSSLDLDSSSFFIAQPLPGTEFWDYCEKNNLFYDGFDTFHLRYGKSNNKVTGITAKELEHYRHIAREEFVKTRVKAGRVAMKGKRKTEYLERKCSGGC